jgi:hypothetical protein
MIAVECCAFASNVKWENFKYFACFPSSIYIRKLSAGKGNVIYMNLEVLFRRKEKVFQSWRGKFEANYAEIRLETSNLLESDY